MNDELRRAISIAQTAHDRNDGPADNTAVAIGALIRAVTILAGEQPTSREESIRMCNETRDAAVLAFGEAADTEIKKVKSEIESLKNRLAEQSARESRLHVVLSDHGLPTEPKALARALAQRNAPITIDGKTPGQVFAAEFLVGGSEAVRKLGRDTLASMERGADAVLRAFCQPSQTARANAVDALRDCLERVRERLGEEERGFGGEHLVVPRPMWMAIIDDELAKLGQASPTSEQVHNVVPVQIGVVTKGRRMCMACAGWGHDGASAYRGATCGACKGTGCQ